MKEFMEKRRIFIAVLVVGLFAMSARNVTDPDLWWHLRTGQSILQNRAVFHADPYSFTRFGQPWVNHEWLSDILIFGFYRWTGWTGLIIGFGAITTAIFFLTFLRCAENPSVALLTTVWSALACAPFWGARPQMFSLLLISIFLLILDRSDRRLGLLWWLPPLTILWVNLHAGYVAGIGLLLIFLVGDALDSAFGAAPRTQAAPRIRSLALVLVVCLASVPLNPYGWKMYSYPFATLNSEAMQSHIAEWSSPDFHQAQSWPALLLILASVLAIAYARRLLPSRELILLLTTMYVGLRSQRHLAIYALVTAPILSRLIDAWLRERQHTGRVSRPAKPLTTGKALVNLTILLALATFAGLRVRHVVRHQSAAEAARFPAAAVAFLAAQKPPGPIFNHYDWGGYFIWKLYPEYRVYIDGRADLYGDSFMNQFSADYECRADCGQSSLDFWRIRTVILPPEAPMITALIAGEEWKRIYSDSQATILSRTLIDSHDKY